MSPSCPGRPSNRPATSTPIKSRGRICFAKLQLDSNQLPASSVRVPVMTLSPMTPTVNGARGSCGTSSAVTVTATAASASFQASTFIHKTITTASAAAAAAVIAHLAL